MDEEILNVHSSTNNTVCVTVKKRQKTFESLPDKIIPLIAILKTYRL